MKQLIIINGAPGVGKTAVSKALNNYLSKSIWIDGDWCWMMDPFIVNDENKVMVESNIDHLLMNAIQNSHFDHIIFNWVIPSDSVMNRIMSRLDQSQINIHKFTLTCDAAPLKKRMMKDQRSSDQIKKSIKDQDRFNQMATIKINTSDLSVDEVVKKIGETIC